MTDQERMERCARQAADARDRQLRHIESNRAAMLAEAKRVYEERVARIGRDATAARERVFWQCECAQDAALNFIETKNDRARADHVGLDVPFLHPSKVFHRRIADGLRHAVAS